MKQLFDRSVKGTITPGLLSSKGVEDVGDRVTGLPLHAAMTMTLNTAGILTCGSQHEGLGHHRYSDVAEADQRHWVDVFERGGTTAPQLGARHLHRRRNLPPRWCATPKKAIQ